MSTTDPGRHTSTVTIWKIIRNATLPVNSNIHAGIMLNGVWLLHDNPLPPLNNTVAFTGHLLTFESDNAVPAVDGIWFLP